MATIQSSTTKVIPGASRHNGVKGGKALKRTAGVGGRGGRHPSTPPRGKTMLQNSSSVEVFKGPFGAHPHQAAHERRPALTWAPAKQAYVVMDRWPAGKRLILITRGERHAYRVVTSPDTTGMPLKALRSLASKLNRKMGIPFSAAKALAVDWNNNFSMPP